MSFAVIATPGPGVAHVVLSSILGGQQLAGFAILGILSGHCLAISISLGIGYAALGHPVILANGQWFAALVLGALGLRSLRLAWRPGDTTPGTRLRSRGWGEGKVGAALTGFVLTLLNPMSLAFFASAAVGFLDLDQPLLGQGSFLGLLYVCTAAVVHGTYALIACRLHGKAIEIVGRTQRQCRVAAAVITLFSAGLVALQASARI